MEGDVVVPVLETAEHCICCVALITSTNDFLLQQAVHLSVALHPISPQVSVASAPHCCAFFSWI